MKNTFALKNNNSSLKFALWIAGFCKGYLVNVVQIDLSNFIIQLSYLGVNENTPILSGSFEILAKYRDDKFYFLSPLKRNPLSW